MEDCKCGRCEWCTLTNPVECACCGDVLSATDINKDGYCSECAAEKETRVDKFFEED